MTELEELRIAYAECNRQRNELLAKHKQAAQEKAEPQYLSIERVEGFPEKLEQGPQPLLYSDGINGCMVRRDDVWLALTSQLAIPQPAPSTSPAEAVGIVDEGEEGLFVDLETPTGVRVKRGDRLYTAPSTSKPLTDHEMWALWNAQGVDDMIQHEAIAFARAIEAAHKIGAKP